MHYKLVNLPKIVALTCLLLLLPLMFTITKLSGWNWSFFDFLLMGLLVAIVFVSLDFSFQNIRHPLYKAAAAVAIIGVGLLVWAELAVNAVSRFL